MYKLKKTILILFLILIIMPLFASEERYYESETCIEEYGCTLHSAVKVQDNVAFINIDYSWTDSTYKEGTNNSTNFSYLKDLIVIKYLDECGNAIHFTRIPFNFSVFLNEKRKIYRQVKTFDDSIPYNISERICNVEIATSLSGYNIKDINIETKIPKSLHGVWYFEDESIYFVITKDDIIIGDKSFFSELTDLNSYSKSSSISNINELPSLRFSSTYNSFNIAYYEHSYKPYITYTFALDGNSDNLLFTITEEDSGRSETIKAERVL